MQALRLSSWSWAEGVRIQKSSMRWMSVFKAFPLSASVLQVLCSHCPQLQDYNALSRQFCLPSTHNLTESPQLNLDICRAACCDATQIPPLQQFHWEWTVFVLSLSIKGSFTGIVWLQWQQQPPSYQYIRNYTQEIQICPNLKYYNSLIYTLLCSCDYICFLEWKNTVKTFCRSQIWACVCALQWLLALWVCHHGYL